VNQKIVHSRLPRKAFCGRKSNHLFLKKNTIIKKKPGHFDPYSANPGLMPSLSALPYSLLLAWATISGASITQDLHHDSGGASDQDDPQCCFFFNKGFGYRRLLPSHDRSGRAASKNGKAHPERLIF
jgi:hypothetical protein